MQSNEDSILRIKFFFYDTHFVNIILLYMFFFLSLYKTQSNTINMIFKVKNRKFLPLNEMFTNMTGTKKPDS